MDAVADAVDADAETAVSTDAAADAAAIEAEASPTYRNRDAKT